MFQYVSLKDKDSVFLKLYHDQTRKKKYILSILKYHISAETSSCLTSVIIFMAHF